MLKKIVFVLVMLCIVLAKHKIRFPQYTNTTYEQALRYSVGYFNQNVSHFNFKPLGTFRQKYLIDTTYWNRAGGPILFYCGNEGPVEMFYNNSGFYN
jgi:hypothetical protein